MGKTINYPSKTGTLKKETSVLVNNVNTKIIIKKTDTYDEPRIFNIIIERLPEEKLTFLEFSKLSSTRSFALPSLVDLRSKFSLPVNQGNLGSCTACALCGVMTFINKINNLSRLFLYYNERVLDNTVAYDSGAYLSDGIKCLTQSGVCKESTWPYIISKFAVRPPTNCYTEALLHKAISFANIRPDLISMKTSLNNGFPFVLGIKVYSSFLTVAVARTGYVPMPNLKTDKLLGGHAIVCCGYNDQRRVWIMRNSWGTSWGDRGYFYLPYAYLNSSYASDLWTIYSAT